MLHPDISTKQHSKRWTSVIYFDRESGAESFQILFHFIVPSRRTGFRLLHKKEKLSSLPFFFFFFFLVLEEFRYLALAPCIRCTWGSFTLTHIRPLFFHTESDLISGSILVGLRIHASAVGIHDRYFRIGIHHRLIFFPLPGPYLLSYSYEEGSHNGNGDASQTTPADPPSSPEASPGTTNQSFAKET